MERCIFKGLPIYDSEVLDTLNRLFLENRGQVLAALPWLVSELIELIGFAEAIAFIYEHGGRRIYLGGDCRDLSAKLGLPVTEKLYDRIAYGADSSGYVEIPSPWGVSERIRWAMIQSALRNGVSPEEIRRVYGASRRTLTNLRKESANPSRSPGP